MKTRREIESDLNNVSLTIREYLESFDVEGKSYHTSNDNIENTSTLLKSIREELREKEDTILNECQDRLDRKLGRPSFSLSCLLEKIESFLDIDEKDVLELLFHSSAEEDFSPESKVRDNILLDNFMESFIKLQIYLSDLWERIDLYFPEEERATKQREKSFLLKYIVPGKDSSRQYQKLHELCKGQTGKSFAMVIRGAIDSRVLRCKPTVPDLRKEFGNIGGNSNISKYLEEGRFTKSELSPIVEAFQDSSR